MAASENYRRDIDGLRAIAVLPVLLFHGDIGPFTGGFVGVDVFFVISGFLITSLLLNDLERGTFSIARFYERRARRILPALVFLLLVVTAAACLSYPPSELAAYGKRLFATSIFAANIHFWLLADYFAPKAEGLELLHVWSLAVEEQFYLFFPPILWAVARWVRPAHIPVLFLAAAALSLAISAYGITHYPVASFYLLPSRAWELLLGSLLAFRFLPTLSLRWAQVLSLAGIALLMIAIFGFTAATPFPGIAALVPCLGAFLIIYAGQHHADTLVAQVLATRPMVAIGLISYSLYLWHWPLLVMPSLYLSRALTGSETVLLLLASFAFAFFSWKFVEAPFRLTSSAQPSAGRPTVRIRSSHRPLALAGGTVVVIALTGILLTGSRGLPWRVSEDVLLVEAAAEEGLASFAREEDVSCLNGLEGWDDKCAASGIPIFVWGDSHAVQHSAGIRELANGRRIGRYGMGGCPPLLDTSFIITSANDRDTPMSDAWKTARLCRELNDRALQSILARKDVEVVILGGAWQFFSEGSKLVTGEGRYAVAGSSSGPLDIASSRQALERGLFRTVDALRSQGIRVLLLGDIPEHRYPPSSCLARAFMFGRDPRLCETDGYQARDRLKFSDALITRMTQLPGVYAFKPADYLCLNGRCPLMRAETLLYMDADHITPDASLSLSRHMQPDILQGWAGQERISPNGPRGSFAGVKPNGEAAFMLAAVEGPGDK